MQEGGTTRGRGGRCRNRGMYEEVRRGGSACAVRGARVEDEGDDEAVQADDLGKDLLGRGRRGGQREVVEREKRRARRAGRTSMRTMATKTRLCCM